MKIGSFKNLSKAFDLVAADNGMDKSESLDERDCPPEWLDRFTKADEAAGDLAISELRDVVDEDQVDADLASVSDNALETMCAGEHSVQALIIASVGSDAQALADVLESAFDGELSDLIFAD